MPKRLIDVRGRLLSAARDLLLNEGYDHLTLREVASRCQIAVGTIYNYFSSRELLIAEALLEDWFSTLSSLKEQSNQNVSPIQALELIYRKIEEYIMRYSPTWKNMNKMNFSMDFFWKQQERLVEQIEETIREKIFQNSGPAMEDPALKEYLPHFLAKSILAGVSSGEPFEQSRLIFEKLLR